LSVHSPGSHPVITRGTSSGRLKLSCSSQLLDIYHIVFASINKYDEIINKIFKILGFFLNYVQKHLPSLNGFGINTNK
jgi:hypothetical protein